MEEKIMRVLTDDWQPSYLLVKRNTSLGFLGVSGDRIARDMAVEGKILRKRDGKYAYYRLKSVPTQEEFISCYDCFNG